MLSHETASAREPVNILVLESRHMKAYQVALRGFRTAIIERGYDPTITMLTLNADVSTPDELQSTCSQHKADLILALGTDAAKLVKEANLAIPSVFAMVSEPGASGLLNSGESAGTPMTGSCLDVPVSEQFASLLEVVPGIRRIGVIYDPNESQLMVDEGRVAANRMDLGFVAYPVHSETEVPKALSAIRPRIDALWLVSDRTVLTTQSLQYIFLFAFQNNLPLMGLSEHFVRMGALLAVGPDYEDVGRQSGELAAKILKGRDPDELPVVSPRKLMLSLNLRTAKIIGLDIPDRVVRKAAVTY